jgi:arylsulfatase A-like enzyme
MYDDVVRVPLMLRWPKAIAAGTTFDGFVSHALDLAATFASVANAELPASFAGVSLIDQLDGSPASARQDIISAYHGGQFGLYSQRMLRDRRWKYVWNPTAEDELYDLEGDPAELRNVARDPAFRDELRRLRHRLLEWLRETGDPLAQWAGAVQLGEGRTL